MTAPEVLSDTPQISIGYSLTSSPVPTTPPPRTSVPVPVYGTGQIEISRRGWWHFAQRYRWQMTFVDCKFHTSAGCANTEEGCQAQGRAVDTQHAMHHARLVQRQRFLKRIRADD